VIILSNKPTKFNSVKLKKRTRAYTAQKLGVRSYISGIASIYLRQCCRSLHILFVPIFEARLRHLCSWDKKIL